MQSNQFVLGIDGGGTKTLAWLASRSGTGRASVVGRGEAGPANPQAVGFPKAIEHLNRAVDAALDDAEVQPGPLAAAVLALAGSDRDENRRVLQRWADERQLAARFLVVHDALPVLATGTPDGWGVALISGTGSLAFGQSPDGRSARAGGWGYLFGDEGSGYAIAMAGLRAVAMQADGRGEVTGLTEALLARLSLAEPQQLIPAIYEIAADRAAIALLARVVSDAGEQGDAVAQVILDEAARELAVMVAAAADKLGLSRDAFPLALAGGVLLGSEQIRTRLRDKLRTFGLHANPIAIVAEPVLGAVQLAQAQARS